MLVGEIIRAHGIQGEVLVRPHTDHPSRFAPESRLWLDEILESAVTVSSSRSHTAGLIVKLLEVEDRAAAEGLRGKELFIDPSQVVAPEEGAFWVHQLVGFDVVDSSGKVLGTVAAIHVREFQDLWEVETPGGPFLLPAVRQFVKDINEPARRVVVDPPDGLFGEVQ